MHPVEPGTDGAGDATAAAQAGALLRAVRERLAESSSPSTPPALVLGLWIPWDGLCVAALGGEMDIANASELRDALVARAPDGPRYLVVELSQLTFMDSLAIHALTKLAREAKSNNGAVVIAGARGHVDRVLEIVKIDELVERIESLEAALQRVAELAADDADRTMLHHWLTLADATRMNG